MNIRELLSDETKWVQNVMATDKKGTPCLADDPEAVRFCLLGAANRCYGIEKGWCIRNKIYEEIQKRGYHSGVAAWNDDPERKFEEVKELVEALDI